MIAMTPRKAVSLSGVCFRGQTMISMFNYILIMICLPPLKTLIILSFLNISFLFRNDAANETAAARAPHPVTDRKPRGTLVVVDSKCPLVE